MRRPKNGAVYEVTRPFITLANKVYNTGDRLELVEPTGLNPFNHPYRGGSWLVKCRFFSPPAKESVWTCITGAIEDGTLKLVGAAPKEDRCEHGMFFSGAGACPQCGGGAE